MDRAEERASQGPKIIIEHNGIKFQYTPEQMIKMGAELEKARADGLFPKSKCLQQNFKHIFDDYMRLLQLTEARGDTPREQWNQKRNIVELLIQITREIRDRDELAADLTEDERVRAHVANMMSGATAETKLYRIVQHAVLYAGAKNGGVDKDAVVAGQNMAALLEGIRGVIKEMAGQSTHGIGEANVEAVLEDIFGIIDFALEGHAKDMDKQANRVEGQIKHVDGQIMHLNAIGQHVNAIDGHVHSLGNNINSFGTLLNSTNGNVVSLTTQISLLQTIVNMLPRMIEEALKQMIPGTLQGAMYPIIDAIQAQLKVKLTNTMNAPARRTTRQKISKFFSRGFKGIFKKSSGGAHLY